MKDSTTKNRIGKKWIRGGVVAALWLLLWQVAASAVGQELLLVFPATVLRRLTQLVRQPVFWQAVFSSCGRIMSGVLLALAVGMLLAALMSRFSFLYAFFRPALQVMKATPVASFIILALVWLHSDILGAFAAFLMVLPMVWANLYEGIGAVDKDLLEMTRAYGFSWGKKLRYLYLPYFAAACSTGIGIGWKAGVAAEVLGLPKNSIGKALYNAKIYLEMPDLFGWTVVIILLSLLFEKLAAALLRAVTMQLAKGGKPDEKLQKAYNGRPVLAGFSLDLPDSGIVCLTGASGRGKTTLLRILAGLEAADGGRIEGLFARKIAYVFQEDRLLPWVTAGQNIRLAQPAGEKQLFPEVLMERAGLESGMADRYPDQLSGGQRRRVAFLRGIAFLADSPDGILLLDEPFNGLDEAAAQKLCQILRELPSSVLTVLVSHQTAMLEGLNVTFFSMGD